MLSGMNAAIDANDFAGHEGGIFGKQHGDNAGDLLRLADLKIGPAQRTPPLKCKRSEMS